MQKYISKSITNKQINQQINNTHNNKTCQKKNEEARKRLYNGAGLRDASYIYIYMYILRIPLLFSIFAPTSCMQHLGWLQQSTCV